MFRVMVEKMHNKKDIVKTLNEFNYFIDEITLNNFIKNWKIDPIYEDEDGVEFYDNMAIVKLKKGISLKSQGFSNDQIIYHINKILPEKLANEERREQVSSGEAKELPMGVSFTPQQGELKNVTVDITGQTLQLVADVVAEKISAGIKEQLQNPEFIQGVLQDSALKKDNELLARQVEELLEDNKKLAQRVYELERKRGGILNFIKKIMN